MIEAGMKLGPYEIQGPLGAGGMGEVYRARDTRLNRTVAIKVLPGHLSSNADLKQRFEREARAISSLQHPHICTLFDVGSQDGVDFLVMEYLEGETLAERLVKGPLKIEEALKIAMEMARALDKAHRQGIVHRDLKPGNIMLTKAGAKLMDFGLAKPALAVATGASGNVTPNTPTISVAALTSPASPLTQKGTIVGTFQYMAPEVLQGAEADARSDLFSFGCVLYEMITGRRAFEGKSQISVLAAILEKEPEPLQAAQPLAPRVLDRVVRGCLVKAPEERIQTAHDLAMELSWIGELQERPAAAPARSRRAMFAFAAIAGLMTLLAIGTWLWKERSRPELATLQASIDPGNLMYGFTGDDGGPPVLSPDGKLLAFRARTSDSAPALWIRHMDTGVQRRLEGTEGATFPFWSPDSKNLAFVVIGKLERIGVDGGTVIEIARMTRGRGGSWGANDMIAYAPDFQSPIYVVSAKGGDPRPVTKLDQSKHTTHRWPQLLPDGKHLLYFATNHSGGDPSQNGIYFASLDGKENHLVVASEAMGLYSAGYLLFDWHGALRAQPFDASSGALSGDAVTVSDNLQVDAATWHASITASDSGLLLFARGGEQVGSQLVWVGRDAKLSPTPAARASYTYTRLSPDGNRAVVTIAQTNLDVWVIDMVRGTPTRLTFDLNTHITPIWSPDGKRIAYATARGSFSGLFNTPVFVRNADGSGQEEPLLAGDPKAGFELMDWTADGRYLVYLRNPGPFAHTIWALPLFGDRKPFQILAPPSANSTIEEAHVSPDGRWLAYVSNESGIRQVYLTSFPTASGKWQLSTNGGTHAIWKHDGRELYFGTPYDNSQIMGVEIDLHDAAPKWDVPHPLFGTLSKSPLGMGWDVTPDGKKVLVSEMPEETAKPLDLRVNWTTELKKK